MLNCIFFFGGTWVSYAFNGWVLSLMWKWYVVPIVGLPILTIPQAVGVVLLASLLIPQIRPPYFGDNLPLSSRLTAWAMGLLDPSFILMTGWLLHELYK